MNKVLITGITGFLGSHIAENLIASDIKVIGLKRKNSDTWRCKGFEDAVHWVDLDDEKELSSMSFDTVIHGAWIGVEADLRDNWGEQSKNISFLLSLLEISKNAGASKFIFLGSQAEYGNCNGKINEEYPANALNAYASVKLACLELVKTFCLTNNINWIWLRLFSFFGEKENSNWLIPSLIRSMKTEDQKDFTKGEQKYAYLYVKDFATIMNKIVQCSIQSGIYNISSSEVRTIKSLIEEIRDYVNPNFVLNFGALPYRENQSMHMEGDNEKLFSQIGKIFSTDFRKALVTTLEYYIKNNS
jgi:nucleoside-diphosphate-sugar epimerase